jgi:hypothetical protein
MGALIAVSSEMGASSIQCATRHTEGRREDKKGTASKGEEAEHDDGRPYRTP